ncbi:hypothetical protein GS399_02440 [Pedobacter sp. HMF7647]|uniref:Uncharacterized protein n=1 Tax=Hufsiella arboris TaxID=2695275 RepID=A0A7K1Y5E6_9SPHI|nr:hypothetical protein [Hufsiella arboris]MXV49813.1 hypothetical protein [Hufsiella arboris]
MPGKKITLDEAKKLIKNYQGDNTKDKLLSLTIDADMIRAVIDQKDCQYVRFYIAKNTAEVAETFDPTHTLVIIGADGEEKSITESGEIYEDLGACPPICPKDDF